MSTLADELECELTLFDDSNPDNRDQALMLLGDFLVQRGRAILAALRSTDALAVPREPTEEMIAAGVAVLQDSALVGDRYPAIHCYRAMYDAAQGTRSKP